MPVPSISSWQLLPLIALLAMPMAGHAEGPALLVLGAGGTDVLRGNRSAGDFRLEYRSDISLLPFTEPYLQVRPWAGVEVTTRASVWGGGGFVLDIPIGHFVLSPSVGVGGYSRGSGRDLGSTIEFRSQFEGGYVFDDASRLTVGFSHTSNAGIGRNNPGTEAVVVSYQVSLGRLFGR